MKWSLCCGVVGLFNGLAGGGGRGGMGTLTDVDQIGHFVHRRANSLRLDRVRENDAPMGSAICTV